MGSRARSAIWGMSNCWDAQCTHRPKSLAVASKALLLAPNMV